MEGRIGLPPTGTTVALFRAKLPELSVVDER